MAGSDTARTPSATGWPEQMITQAEAFGLAAKWPVRTEIVWHMIDLPPGAHPTFTISLPMPADSGPEVVLRCAKDRCNQSCGQLARGSVTYNGSLDEMLSMVLRHMVMAHDVPLAGLRQVHDQDCRHGGRPHAGGCFDG